MADNNLIENIDGVLEKVLQKEYGLDLSDVQSKIDEYEDKQQNRTEKTLSVAISTWGKLNEILIADGATLTDGEATSEQIAEWLDEKIEDAYLDYVSNGRFDTPSEDETEEPTT